MKTDRGSFRMLSRKQLLQEVVHDAYQTRRKPRESSRHVLERIIDLSSARAGWSSPPPASISRGASAMLCTTPTRGACATATTGPTSSCA
jgi:hypothetical protein